MCLKHIKSQAQILKTQEGLNTRGEKRHNLIFCLAMHIWVAEAFISSPVLCSLCCADVNECNVDNGACTQTCNNLPGTYACDCIAGFELERDGKTCTGNIHEFMHARIHSILSIILLSFLTA